MPCMDTSRKTPPTGTSPGVLAHANGLFAKIRQANKAARFFIPDGTLSLWAAGLEDALLNRDHVTREDGVIALPDLVAKRAAFYRIADSWDGPQAAEHYATFCRLNGIDMEAMHWKHAMNWEMLEELREVYGLELVVIPSAPGVRQVEHQPLRAG